LEHAQKQVNGEASAVNAPDRVSRVMTETDAFGRPRVPRGPRRRRETNGQIPLLPTVG
jgi:hypothetical protein